jgi:hypothetical protein
VPVAVAVTIEACTGAKVAAAAMPVQISNALL